MNNSAILDPRHIENGWEIPSENYVDQPYIVQTDDGAWLCVMTTGHGKEGEAGQHIITTRSFDQGRTWSTPVDVEPADGPEASYAVLLKHPNSPRVFVFYNHNTDRIKTVKIEDNSDPRGYLTRVDSLGYFVYKYSDDHGQTWSTKRFTIPIRETEIDRTNIYGGKIRFFWNVGKAFLYNNAAFVPLIKVGGFGHGFFTRNEGVLLKSADLLMVDDPAHAHWETLPDGDYGLRTPAGGGPIAGEQSYSVLSDGSFFAVYRTIDGHPACAYSRDGGHHWEEPQYMTYADGRRIKHPRAANFAWRCTNGKYLYWFHNHGGKWFDDRNPVWLLGGTEADGPTGKVIRWSQPEIVLYTDDPKERLSYPDLIETEDGFYLTETQKTVARVHAIPQEILDGLWNPQPPNADSVLLKVDDPVPTEITMPQLPVLYEPGQPEPLTRKGFTIEIIVKLQADAVLLDNRDEAGKGFALRYSMQENCFSLCLSDGTHKITAHSDAGAFDDGRLHHIAVIMDGAPHIISWIIDGQYHDGADQRQFGWTRFPLELVSGNGADVLRVGAVESLHIYGRALRTAEVIANYHHLLR